MHMSVLMFVWYAQHSQNSLRTTEKLKKCDLRAPLLPPICPSSSSLTLSLFQALAPCLPIVL